MGFKHGHGKPQTPLYKAWAGMNRRCFNPNDTSYAYYGGRGITVCARWRDFISFMQDMGPHPGKGWTLDRKNTNGNYTPRNCRWATRLTQGRNNRQAKLTEATAILIRQLYADGRTQASIAEQVGVTKGNVHKVLRNDLWDLGTPRLTSSNKGRRVITCS